MRAEPAVLVHAVGSCVIPHHPHLLQSKIPDNMKEMLKRRVAGG